MVWGGEVMEFEMDDVFSNLGVTEVKFIISKQSRNKRKHYSMKEIDSICNESRW